MAMSRSSAPTISRSQSLRLKDTMTALAIAKHACYGSKSVVSVQTGGFSAPRLETLSWALFRPVEYATSAVAALLVAEIAATECRCRNAAAQFQPARRH